MKDMQCLHARGSDFLRDPILAAHGVVADVAAVLPVVSQTLGELVQVRLRGRSPGDAVLSLTVKTLEHKKEIIECQVRPEVFPVVRSFFEQRSVPPTTPSAQESRLPAASPEAQLLAITEDIANRLSDSKNGRGAKASTAVAIGDALGIAVLVHDEGKVTELAARLREVLGLDPKMSPGPARARAFLNSIAPAMRAAAATGRFGVLLSVISTVVPDGCVFAEPPPPAADIGKFTIGIKELLEHCPADDVAQLIQRFAAPNLMLQLMNAAIDACHKSGSATAISRCGDLVQLLLVSCKSAQDIHSEPGIRAKAFEAALSGDFEKTKSLVDDIPRWARTEEIFGWLTGYAVGLQVRAKHELKTEEVVGAIEHLIYRKVEDHFDALAVEFVRGMLAANQGANGLVSELILQRLEDRHPNLQDLPRFLSGRFVHQIVVAHREGNENSIEAVLKDFFQTARLLSEKGDALIAAMCEELLTDISIRDSALRAKIAVAISMELRNEKEPGRYELSRLVAAPILYTAGFPKAALRAPPDRVVGESGRFVWHIRAADQKSRELARGTLAQTYELHEKLDRMRTTTSDPALEWGAVIEESAAVGQLSLALKAIGRAVEQSSFWKPSDVGYLTDALFVGMLRRENALKDH